MILLRKLDCLHRVDERASGVAQPRVAGCGQELREILASHKDLARKLEELEKKYDKQFQVVFEAIRQLMAPPPEAAPKRHIGFARD